MARYKVQTPDGNIITVEGPDGASQADVIAQAQSLYNKPAEAKKTGTMGLAETIGREFNAPNVKIGGVSIPGSGRAVDIAEAVDRGLIANTLGAPVDLINLGLQGVDWAANKLAKATGMPEEKPWATAKPVGGGEWIQQQMENAGLVSPTRRPILETAAGLAPIAPSVAKGVYNVGREIAQVPISAAKGALLNEPGTSLFKVGDYYVKPEAVNRYKLGYLTKDQLSLPENLIAKEQLFTSPLDKAALKIAGNQVPARGKIAEATGERIAQDYGGDLGAIKFMADVGVPAVTGLPPLFASKRVAQGLADRYLGTKYNFDPDFLAKLRADTGPAPTTPYPTWASPAGPGPRNPPPAPPGVPPMGPVVPPQAPTITTPATPPAAGAKSITGPVAPTPSAGAPAVQAAETYGIAPPSNAVQSGFSQELGTLAKVESSSGAVAPEALPVRPVAEVKTPLPNVNPEIDVASVGPSTPAVKGTEMPVAQKSAVEVPTPAVQPATGPITPTGRAPIIAKPLETKELVDLLKNHVRTVGGKTEINLEGLKSAVAGKSNLPYDLENLPVSDMLNRNQTIKQVQNHIKGQERNLINTLNPDESIPAIANSTEKLNKPVREQIKDWTARGETAASIEAKAKTGNMNEKEALAYVAMARAENLPYQVKYIKNEIYTRLSSPGKINFKPYEDFQPTKIESPMNTSDVEMWGVLKSTGEKAYGKIDDANINIFKVDGKGKTTLLTTIASPPSAKSKAAPAVQPATGMSALGNLGSPGKNAPPGVMSMMTQESTPVTSKIGTFENPLPNKEATASGQNLFDIMRTGTPKTYMEGNTKIQTIPVPETKSNMTVRYSKQGDLNVTKMTGKDPYGFDVETTVKHKEPHVNIQDELDLYPVDDIFRYGPTNYQPTSVFSRYTNPQTGEIILHKQPQGGTDIMQGFVPKGMKLGNGRTAVKDTWEYTQGDNRWINSQWAGQGPAKPHPLGNNWNKPLE